MTESSGQLRRYTADDYAKGAPCIYRYRDEQQTVEPMRISEKHPFDGSRKLTFKFPSGYVRTTNIDGCDLSCILWTS